RYYFTPLTGVLFTFPSRYSFTIGRRVVLSLGRWSSQIHAGFHVPCATRVPFQSLWVFDYGAVTLYGRPFQAVLLTRRFVTLWKSRELPKWPHDPITAT